MASSTYFAQPHETHPYQGIPMIDIGPLKIEIDAVNRVFADDLMVRRNAGERFWTSDHRLYSEDMLAEAATWPTVQQQLALLASELWGYPFTEGEPRFDIQIAIRAFDHIRMSTMIEAITLRGSKPW